jgi:hypothetical protein
VDQAHDLCRRDAQRRERVGDQLRGHTIVSAFGGSFATLEEVPPSSYSFGGSFGLLETGTFAKTFGGVFAVREAQPPNIFTQSIGGSFETLAKNSFVRSFGGNFVLEGEVPEIVRWMDGNWYALAQRRWANGRWN